MKTTTLTHHSLGRLQGRVLRIPTDPNGKYMGYFWLRVDDNGQDYFAHRTDLENGATMNDLSVGTHVTFRPVKAVKGWRAAEMRVVTEERSGNR